MLKLLEGFHHRAARQITGMTVTHGVDRELEKKPGGDGNGNSVTAPHHRVNQEITGNHRRKDGLLHHILTLH